MSTTPPPDRPTEPLRRARPAPAADDAVVRPAPVAEDAVVRPAPVAGERVVRPAPVVEERLVAPVVDPNVILLRLEDTIDALRTWLVVVGLVAVAALGVALYAVLTDDTSGGDGRASDTGLASDERVSRIENRVDRLSRQLQDVRASGSSGDDAAALASRVDTLEDTVKSLSSQPGDGAGAQQAVDQLSGRIDDLAADVEQLKQASSTP
jgi:outer membrane murein-binding lipoprotein Lpp